MTSEQELSSSSDYQTVEANWWDVLNTPLAKSQSQQPQQSPHQCVSPSNLQLASTTAMLQFEAFSPSSSPPFRHLASPAIAQQPLPTSLPTPTPSIRKAINDITSSTTKKSMEFAK